MSGLGPGEVPPGHERVPGLVWRDVKSIEDVKRVSVGNPEPWIIPDPEPWIALNPEPWITLDPGPWIANPGSSWALNPDRLEPGTLDHHGP